MDGGSKENNALKLLPPKTRTDVLYSALLIAFCNFNKISHWNKNDVICYFEQKTENVSVK